MKIFLFLVVGFFLASAVHADVTTHAIGDTGYMIREAMQAKAYKYDEQNYHQAVQLQGEAKKWLRGKAKKGRNKEKAVELTKQAYVLAKTARDTALKAQGLRTSR